MKEKFLFVLKLLFTLFIFYFIFNKIEIDRLYTFFKEIHITNFCFCIFLILVGRLILAFNTKALLQIIGVTYRYIQVIKINFTSFFYSFAGELLGSAIRWKRLAGKNNRYAQAVFLIVLERLILVLYLMIFAASGFFTSGISTVDEPQKIILIALFTIFGIFLTGSIVCLFSRPINIKLSSFFKRMVSCSPVNSITYKTYSTVSKLFEYLLNNKFAFTLIFTFQIAHSAITFLTGLLIFRMFGINLSLYAIIWILSATALISMLPITVFGLGLREGALIYLLGKYSISPELGLTIGLVYFSFSLIEGIIGGFIEVTTAFLGNKS